MQSDQAFFPRAFSQGRGGLDWLGGCFTATVTFFVILSGMQKRAGKWDFRGLEDPCWNVRRGFRACSISLRTAMGISREGG